MEIHANEFQLVDEILMSFVKIALKLNSDFAPYISLIQKAIRRNKVQDRCAQFDLAIKTITKNDPIETFQQNLELNEVGDLFADNNEHFVGFYGVCVCCRCFLRVFSFPPDGLQRNNREITVSTDNNGNI